MNGVGKFTQAAISTTVSTLTALPPDLSQIVGSYAYDTNFSALLLSDLEFDRDGRVTNPEIRDAYKEAFMSFYCDPALKNFLLYNLFHRSDEKLPRKTERMQNEIRNIFDEIVQAGYRICLDGVCLDGLRLTYLNLSNASMRTAQLTNSTLLKVNFSGADLSGTKFDSCYLLLLNMTKANRTGCEFSSCAQVEITW